MPLPGHYEQFLEVLKLEHVGHGPDIMMPRDLFLLQVSSLSLLFITRSNSINFQ